MIDINDPAIRREVYARLERERDSTARLACGRRFPAGWVLHLIAHLFYHVAQKSG